MLKTLLHGKYAGFTFAVLGVGAIISVTAIVRFGYVGGEGTKPTTPTPPAGKPQAATIPNAPYHSSTEGLPVGGEWRGRPDVADLNQDGLVDIVCSVRKGEGLFTFLNQNGGKSWKPSIAGLPRNAGYGGSSVADVNKDGFPDIVFSTHGSPIQVYLGDGKGGGPDHAPGWETARFRPT